MGAGTDPKGTGRVLLIFWGLWDRQMRAMVIHGLQVANRPPVRCTL